MTTKNTKKNMLTKAQLGKQVNGMAVGFDYSETSTEYTEKNK